MNKREGTKLQITKTKHEFCGYDRYERFVFALEEASRDVLAILKDKALKVSLSFLLYSFRSSTYLLCAVHFLVFLAFLS